MKNSLFKVALNSIILFFCFAGMFTCISLDALKRQFPLDQPEAVIFTLTQNTEGSERFVYAILEESLVIAIDNEKQSLFIAFIFSLILLLLFRLKKKTNFRDFTHQFIKFFCIFFIILNGCFFIFSAINIPFYTYAKKYYTYFSELPQKNTLYSKEYIHPDSIRITFNKKNNLLFLMLESMESNFQEVIFNTKKENLIPEISEYIKNNISFFPGGITIKGTGWTIGEVVAKNCAVPLIGLINNMKSKKSFLPKAPCLMNILQENGYSFYLIQGSSIKFASMDNFLKSHKVDRSHIYDISNFQKYLTHDSIFFDMIPDYNLYNETKKIISKISSDSSKPWAIQIFTMDTHGPYGRFDSNCIDIPLPENIESQYPNVLRCASKLLDNFLKWAKEQPWYKNTTIVVMGDHPAMIDKDLLGFSQNRENRLWLNFFINSTITPSQKQRTFTSLDMLPTVLEAMGVQIEGHALGLGRSLFSNEKTLIEKYGKDSLNTLINKRSIEYESFWN